MGTTEDEVTPARRATTTPEQFVTRRMTLRHARTLLAVMEAGSVSAAADRLNVTQPAVSKTLAEIEEGVGAPLFAGSKRHPRPTALCMRLATLARKLEAALRRAANEAGSFARGATGELVIGASNAALQGLLPDAAVEMLAEFPNLTLTFSGHPVERMFDELRAGSIDVVLARVPWDEHPADLRPTLLGNVPEVLVVSRRHAMAADRSRITWEAACGSAWLWPVKGTRKRELQDRMWRRNALPAPSSVVELGDTALALSLLQRCELFAILPQHTAEMAQRLGVADTVPLAVDYELGDLYLWHTNEPQTEVVERFKQVVSRIARQRVAAGLPVLPTRGRQEAAFALQAG
jgi:DNA-binding transcriptional LysR family regulator